MAKLKNMQLKGRSSYAKWWPQVVWKARVDGVWDLIDPDGPEDASAYNTSPPALPPMINELKAKLDVKRTTAHIAAINTWNAQRTAGGGEPDPATTPSTPLPAEFEDVQAEHAALIQDYTSAGNDYKMRSEQLRRFLNWLTKTVDPDIWVATITVLLARMEFPPASSSSGTSSVGTLSPAQDHGSIQGILRSLKRHYAPSGMNSSSNQIYRSNVQLGVGAV